MSWILFSKLYSLKTKIRKLEEIWNFQDLDFEKTKISLCFLQKMIQVTSAKNGKFSVGNGERWRVKIGFVQTKTQRLGWLNNGKQRDKKANSHASFISFQAQFGRYFGEKLCRLNHRDEFVHGNECSQENGKTTRAGREHLAIIHTALT